MPDTCNWYVLYTKTNAEERVMHGMGEAFRKMRLDYRFEPFCPNVEYYFRNKQAKIDGTNYRVKRLFPNYVFIETDMPEEKFIETFDKFILDSSDIIRLLRYSEKNIALHPEEKARLEALLEQDRCLKRSVGKIIGGKVVVESGPLRGQENHITYVDRHNRAATVEFDIFYGKVIANAALEITEKVA